MYGPRARRVMARKYGSGVIVTVCDLREGDEFYTIHTREPGQQRRLGVVLDKRRTEGILVAFGGEEKRVHPAVRVEVA